VIKGRPNTRQCNEDIDGIIGIDQLSTLTNTSNTNTSLLAKMNVFVARMIVIGTTRNPAMGQWRCALPESFRHLTPPPYNNSNLLTSDSQPSRRALASSPPYNNFWL